MKRLLAIGLLSLPLAAQSFGDGTAFGGSSVFSNGGDPRANPARYDQLPEGYYLGADLGDLKPKGDAPPWAVRMRRAGLAWAWTGGIRFGYTREDLRGALDLDPAAPGTRFDARQAVVDRLYAGAGSAAGRSAVGVTLRVERVRFGQLETGDRSAALDGIGTDRSLTSATLDAGYLFSFSDRFRFGLTLDRIAARRFGDLKEDPQGRAGLQFDLAPSARLSFESDLNAAERLPLAVKGRVSAASLRLEVSPSTFFTLGAERRRYEGSAASTVLGAALHLRTAPTVLSLGLRFGDDHPLAAAAFRLPGGP